MKLVYWRSKRTFNPRFRTSSYYRKLFLTTPDVENKCWSLHETLKTTGEMKLMIKFCACLHNSVNFEIYFLDFLWEIDQFRYIKIQPKTIDLSTKLVGINTEFLGFIPKSLVLRSIVLGWILIYRNWSIGFGVISGKHLFISLAFRKW